MEIVVWAKSKDEPWATSMYPKVEGHIPARVWMPPPRVGSTYLGASTWVHKSTYQGAFTVHNAAIILQAANGWF